MLGKTGEDVAARFLQENDYTILERNHRTRIGEIDIIAFRERTLIFCEVKTRASQRYGHPLEAVTPRKQMTIRMIANGYLARKQVRTNFTSVRFDVIGIVSQGNRFEIQHVENAF